MIDVSVIDEMNYRMNDGWEQIRQRLESFPWRVVAGVAAVVAVGIGGCLALRSEERPATIVLPRAAPVAPATEALEVQETSEAEIVVHAAGAVAHPGVYQLDGSARVADLLEAAGGPDDAADLAGINLAALLIDGARVYFPRAGEEPPTELNIMEVPPTQLATSPDGEKTTARLDLNSASAVELETLPGIGPVTAAAIVSYRERVGRFQSVESLLAVSGIGPVKLSRIQDLVTVKP